MLSQKLTNVASQLQAYIITGHKIGTGELETLEAMLTDCADQAKALEKGQPFPAEVENPTFPYGENLRPVNDPIKRREALRVIEAFEKGGAA